MYDRAVAAVIRDHVVRDELVLLLRLLTHDADDLGTEAVARLCRRMAEAPANAHVLTMMEMCLATAGVSDAERTSILTAAEAG